ncbi:hypothetical protein TrVE_jg524 [Triparma verrucosa]|uniref:MOSC domain-containing protein n=1 Tax=Triparma verrucosa TaxID=1606542 RepID=A0A9W7B8E6_9STRA|nr:hypothetical protein TrVE_jg524 [Triparma verrucosa]
MKLGKVLALQRFVIKGFSPDSLQSVSLDRGSSFPKDRTFALLDDSTGAKFDPLNPKFNHKSNFACSFTEGSILSKIRTSFNDESSILTVDDTLTGDTLEFDLNSPSSLSEFSSHISSVTGLSLSVVSSSSSSPFQFGNTQSGLTYDSDSRTIHLINSASVSEYSKRTSRKISPYRFRPNVIIDAGGPFEEFKWVDNETVITLGTCKLLPIKRTVRCEGVKYDPDDEEVVDVVKELSKYFPEYGPYFGVYCKVVEGGVINVDDEITIEDDEITIEDDEDKRGKLWMRSDIDLEKDNVTLMLVDFLVLMSITFYVKIIGVTAAADFKGWDAKPELHSLPETLGNAAALIVAWGLANLRDNGWAGDFEQTRLGKMGKIGRKGGGDATRVTLQTANMWVVATFFIAVFQKCGIEMDETGLAYTVAFLLPSMVVERLLLYFYNVR